MAKVPEKGDFHGTWLRTDGAYRLRIEKGGDGKEVVVHYFNPRPIKVESAKFSRIGDRLTLTVVLRDRGYPGSTYRLVFVPEKRILAGSYTVPGMETFEVLFQPAGEQ